MGSICLINLLRYYVQVYYLLATYRMIGAYKFIWLLHLFSFGKLSSKIIEKFSKVKNKLSVLLKPLFTVPSLPSHPPATGC